MLLYGRPKDLLVAIERELELLAELAGRDKRIDEFIKRKTELLKSCRKAVERLEVGEYQLVAVDKCYIIPLL